jgi:hypothetical protein
MECQCQQYPVSTILNFSLHLQAVHVDIFATFYHQPDLYIRKRQLHYRMHTELFGTVF